MVYSTGYVRFNIQIPGVYSLFSASKMVDSSTPFAFDNRTQIYHQSLYAQQSLSRLLAVNRAALGSISLKKDFELDKRKPVPANTPLAEVAEIGAKESHHAPALLAAVMESLGEQTKFVVPFVLWMIFWLTVHKGIPCF